MSPDNSAVLDALRRYVCFILLRLRRDAIVLNVLLFGADLFGVTTHGRARR
jgi:hypothetical protein